VLAKDRVAKRHDLTLPLHFEACSLKAKIEPSDPGKKRRDSDLMHGRYLLFGDLLHGASIATCAVFCIPIYHFWAINIIISGFQGLAFGRFLSYIALKMMTNADVISERTLREMASSGAISRVRFIGQGDSFSLVISCGMRDKALRAKRGHVREFKSLDSAARYVRSLGLSELEVNVSAWDPSQRTL
jgi:hypothetical protein